MLSWRAEICTCSDKGNVTLGASSVNASQLFYIIHRFVYFAALASEKILKGSLNVNNSRFGDK